MNDAPTTLSRSARIFAFLVRHRSAGVFAGLDADTDSTALPASGEADDAPAQFVSDLEALGPTFIKIGQSLSTRADLVPPDYLAALERMQNHVEPEPFDQIRKTVESELGVKLEKIFIEFDREPLGSASLAQVHRATLRDGRQVAVKVQREGVTDIIQTDLDILAGLAGKADRWTDTGRRMGFAGWVEEFRRTLIAELDYCAEADNLQRFGAHLAAYPELFVPAPVLDLTRRRMLTMELVSGTKVTELSGLRRTEEDFRPMASALMRGYLDQVFVHGEIHADPHPGNLLVTADGRLALLDLGMVAFIPPQRREQLLKLLFAAVDGRGEDVAAAAIDMGAKLKDFDETRYYRDIGQRVARYAASNHAAARQEGRLVLDVVLIGAACGLRTPPELSLLGKTLLNLEATSDALDPDLDLKETVRDHLSSVMRARLASTFSTASLAAEALDLQALLRDSPHRIRQLLTLLADNKLQVRLAGLDAPFLIENLQKIANRISTGIIVASLVMASALIMRNPQGPQLFGYPTLALLLFVMAAVLGFGIVISALLRDRRSPRQTPRRGP